MYAAQKSAPAKLRMFERELTARYAEALLRRRYDDARTLYERRDRVRQAMAQLGAGGRRPPLVLLPRDVASDGVADQAA